MWIMFWVAVLAGQIMLAVDGGGLFAEPAIVGPAGSGAVSFYGW